MQDTVKERLIEFIKSQQLSQGKFEKLLGFSNGYVNSISKGIGGDKLQRIIGEFPLLNPDWLLYGRGEMLSGFKEEVSKNESGEDEYQRTVLSALSAVEKIAESNRILAESNHELSITNKILATSNTDLVQKLAELMDEVREVKLTKYPFRDDTAGQFTSDVDLPYGSSETK